MKTWITADGTTIVQVLSGRSNVFLVKNELRNLLVDTSLADRWEKLELRLNRLGITHIDYLLVTHAHFDHVGNTAKIRSKYQAKVLVHRFDAENLAAGDNIIVQGSAFFTRIITRFFAERAFKRFRYDPCPYDIKVNAFLDLTDMGVNATVIYTPGHTIGCMSLIVNNEVAIVGDAMFGVFPWSIFPPFANNVRQMVHSWGRLLDTDCNLFLPSHGYAKSRNAVLKDFRKWIIRLEK